MHLLNLPQRLFFLAPCFIFSFVSAQELTNPESTAALDISKVSQTVYVSLPSESKSIVDDLLSRQEPKQAAFSMFAFLNQQPTSISSNLMLYVWAESVLLSQGVSNADVLSAAPWSTDFPENIPAVSGYTPPERPVPLQIVDTAGSAGDVVPVIATPATPSTPATTGSTASSVIPAVGVKYPTGYRFTGVGLKPTAQQVDMLLISLRNSGLMSYVTLSNFVLLEDPVTKDINWEYKPQVTDGSKTVNSPFGFPSDDDPLLTKFDQEMSAFKVSVSSPRLVSSVLVSKDSFLLNKLMGTGMAPATFFGKLSSWVDPLTGAQEKIDLQFYYRFLSNTLPGFAPNNLQIPVAPGGMDFTAIRGISGRIVAAPSFYVGGADVGFKLMYKNPVGSALGTTVNSTVQLVAKTDSQRVALKNSGSVNLTNPIFTGEKASVINKSVGLLDLQVSGRNLQEKKTVGVDGNRVVEASISFANKSLNAESNAVQLDDNKVYNYDAEGNPTSVKYEGAKWGYLAQRSDGKRVDGTVKSDPFVSVLGTTPWRLFYRDIYLGQRGRISGSKQIVTTSDSGLNSARNSFSVQSNLRLFPLDVFGIVDYENGIAMPLPSGFTPVFQQVGGIAVGEPIPSVSTKVEGTREPVSLGVPAVSALFSSKQVSDSQVVSGEYRSLISQAKYSFGNGGIGLPSSKFAVTDLSLNVGSERVSVVSSGNVPSFSEVTLFDLGLLNRMLDSGAQLVIHYDGTVPLVVHSGATFGMAIQQVNGQSIYGSKDVRVVIVAPNATVLLRGSVGFIPGKPELLSDSWKGGLRIYSPDFVVVGPAWGGLF
jgi:hypothetical protein